MKSDNPTSALVARWMTHTRNLFDDLDWLLTDSNVLDDFPRELDFPALRQRMEREFVADCSFYLISEDSYELTTIPKSATYHFGVEDDGRFFFDIQLFVNVLAPQMLTIGRQTGIDVERVEEVALLNHARLAAGLEQLAASGFQVTSMLSEQIDAGG